MSVGRYARLSLPRPMHYDTAPQVVDYLTGMIEAELNHGMPANRRMGAGMAVLGRRGVPRRLVGAALRARPRHPKAEMDQLLATVARHWSTLVDQSDHLPSAMPPLSGLLVERTNVDMAFVFGEGRWPLLVAKKVAGGVSDESLRLERDALQRVRDVGVGPRHLGVLSGVWVQEALAGLPLRLDVVDRRNAATLTRPAAFEDLDAALQRLAAHTRRRAPLAPYDAEMLALAEAYPLPGDVAATLERTRRHVQGARLTVVQHADLLAQNWIVRDGRFSGLVDWETCSFEGLPGNDLLEAAVSVFEHGIALRDWSGDLLVELFDSAWSSSAYFDRTRAALGEVLEASGLRTEDADAFLVAYFAHRLGRRLTTPGEGVTDAATLARLLTVVCRSLR